MLIAVIGENCTGKTTLAKSIAETVDAEIMTGKDYLRMAKSESEATTLFKKKLEAAITGDNLIYVVTQPDHLALVPEGATRILVSADLDTIKERFAERMHGHLPEPVAKMLESHHGMFDDGEYDYRFDGTIDDAAELCEAIKERAN